MAAPSPRRGPRDARVTLLAALAALVLATSGHRFVNALVFDDVAVIAEGTLIHEPGRLIEAWTSHTMVASASDPGSIQSVDTYRPLPLMLFAWDAQVGGRDPASYHLTNLVLHLACVFLVFGLALRWLGDERAVPAAYGAAVFAAHPWLVEAHVWINGRSDPLCLLFGASAMIALLEAERRERLAVRVLAALLLLAGLLSKETLLTVFPAILLMPPARGTPRALALRVGPLAAAAAVYLALRVAVLGGARAHRDGAMLLEATRRLPYLAVDGLRELLVPSMPYLRSLRDEYSSLHTATIIACLVALIALLSLALRARRRAPLMAWSLLVVLPPIVPVAILTTVLWPGFGRYLYVPAAGLGWALAEGLARLEERMARPRLARALALTHVLALGALTALFTADFRDDERLYGAAIAARPDVAMGHGWLGMARHARRDDARALAPLERAVELDPSTARYLVTLTRARLRVSDRAGAARAAALGARRFYGQPEEAVFHLLAVNAMTERDPARAVDHLLRCLARRPDREDCRAALHALTSTGPDRTAHRDALRDAMPRYPALGHLLD